MGATTKCLSPVNTKPSRAVFYLVGVDREACARYKHELDKFLPPEYSKVIYTGSNNDSKLLKEFHLDLKKERQIRKSFCKFDQQPKTLIVTEKPLTGYDASVLYAMYLDKPMRDHTLLQTALLDLNEDLQDYVIVHELLHFSVPNHGKLWKSLMIAHLGNYQELEQRLGAQYR